MCSEPSRCERNRTPSSVTLRNSERLKTWKPPESVRIACGQDMNLCRPPSLRTASCPGRRVQMIGIGEDYFSAQLFERFVAQALHARLRAHRHEEGRLHRAVRRVQNAAARTGRIGSCYLKRKTHPSSVSGEDERPSHTAHHPRRPHAECNHIRLPALELFRVYDCKSDGQEYQRPDCEHIE